MTYIPLQNNIIIVLHNSGMSFQMETGDIILRKETTNDQLIRSEDTNDQAEVKSIDEDDDNVDGCTITKLLSHQEAIEQFKDALAEIIVVQQIIFYASMNI